jgi:hypothetical protein
MRKKYNIFKQDTISLHFAKMIAFKYIIPALWAILLMFITILYFAPSIVTMFSEFSVQLFLFIICINVLVTITCVNVIHVISTCKNGYNAIASKKYTVLSLVCVKKEKGIFSKYCLLSDRKKYKIYDRKTYDRLIEGKQCDLIVISNEYGAKLWEVVNI